MFRFLTSQPKNRQKKSFYVPSNQRQLSAASIIKSVLKLRYIALVGVSGAVYSIKEKIEEWEKYFKNIPDVKLPSMDLNSKLKNPATEENSVPKIETSLVETNLLGTNAEISVVSKANETSHADIQKTANRFKDAPSILNTKQLQDRLDEALTEIIEMQKRFQRELDRVEHENVNLKKEIFMLRNELENNGLDMAKLSSKFSFKTLIEQYAEVLDMLSDSKNNMYGFKDNLPRVIVIGDQSSGKTSVLELISKVRIFPRGSGEMMTRSPIMLTLGEGPDNVAFFNDDQSRIYDLAVEEQVKSLRDAIEHRMVRNVLPGKTITNKAVSLTLQGPNVPRMILVDLPGIINTVTNDMSSDAKIAIADLAKEHMSNPNSIILCVQDGSIDAERSLVTELVRNIDPEGRRTLCVLTKLDVAEKNKVNPQRIEKLLSGKLFPMKALGYFSVIAGTGNPDDSIEKISKYEEEYFENSELYRKGHIKPNQAGSQALSVTVSNLFWNMVKTSIESEADSIRSTLFALETEWRHNYPNSREMTREQLFEKAKSEVIDDVQKVCNSIKPAEWDYLINDKLWKIIIPHVFNKIYLPNALDGSSIGFKTQVEIQLKKWVDNRISTATVDAAKEIILNRLQAVFSVRNEGFYYETLQPLREYFLDKFSAEFAWGNNNFNSLHIIQQSSVAYMDVNDRLNWETAAALLDTVLAEELDKLDKEMRYYTGPSSLQQWTLWQSRSPEQSLNSRIKDELTMYDSMRDPSLRPKLNEDEITSILTNLQSKGIDTNRENLCRVWNNLYMTNFCKTSTKNINICRKNFHSNDFSSHPFGCHDVLLFWRVHKLIMQTSLTMRQQLIGSECKRFENFARIVLDDETTAKTGKELIQGRVVELAEEIRKVNKVKETLDRFIDNLQRESGSF